MTLKMAIISFRLNTFETNRIWLVNYVGKLFASTEKSACLLFGGSSNTHSRTYLRDNTNETR